MAECRLAGAEASISVLTYTGIFFRPNQTTTIPDRECLHVDNRGIAVTGTLNPPGPWRRHSVPSSLGILAADSLSLGRPFREFNFCDRKVDLGLLK